MFAKEHEIGIIDMIDHLNKNIVGLKEAQANFSETVRQMLSETIREIRKPRPYVGRA